MPRIKITVSKMLHQRLKAQAEATDSTLSRTAARLLADALADDNEAIPPQDATWGRYTKSGETLSETHQP